MPRLPFVRPSSPVLFLLCPLFGALLPLILPIARNFEYEYATLAAYAVLILFACAGLLSPANFKLKNYWLPALLGPLLSAIPAFIAFRSQLCLCGEKDFWLWWFLQFGPHLLWGQLSFLVIVRLRSSGFSRRFCATLALTILISLLLHLFAGLWLDPQKRISHLLAGFIHGAIYDNWIPLDQGIMLSRATHALLAASAFFLLILRDWRLKAVAIPLLGLSLLLASKSADYPSQSRGIAALEKLMPLERSGERFTIHYSDTNSRILDARLDDLFAATTFHMRDLSQKLLVYDTHVHIFVYPSREEKKLWFGGDGTDITDVVTPSIHINLESWPHSTLRHELVHALASSFAFHGLGFHPNLAFTEGLAVALAPEEDEISLHEGAASLLNSGRLLRAESLFSPLFWSESGRRAYTVAGSILKFLLDRYGIVKVKELYAGSSWQKAFGQDSKTMLDEWRRYLAERYPPASEAITTEALFRYPGILDDVCPHSKALLIKSSEDPLITDRQPTGWDPDQSYWDWRVQLGHQDEPGTALAALQSKVNRLWKDFSPETAADLLARVDRLRQHPPRSIEDLELYLLRFDLLVALERYDEARSSIVSYVQGLASFQISDTLIRQIWVRALLIQEPIDTALPWLRLMAGAERGVPGWNLQYKAWVIKYLFVRNTYFGPKQQDLLRQLSEEVPPPTLPGTFAVEWQRTIGLQWMRSRNYVAAEQAFLKAAAIAPDAKRDALSLYAIEARDRNKWAH